MTLSLFFNDLWNKARLISIYKSNIHICRDMDENFFFVIISSSIDIDFSVSQIRLMEFFLPSNYFITLIIKSIDKSINE